jgi:hypothetical protein
LLAYRDRKLHAVTFSCRFSGTSKVAGMTWIFLLSIAGGLAAMVEKQAVSIICTKLKT